MAPFAAGMSAMPYGKFFLFNATGGIIWAVAFTVLGYSFGQSWQLIEKWSGRAGVFVLFMIVVVVGFGYLYRELSLRRDEFYAWFEGVPSSPFVRKFKQRHISVL